MTLYRYKSIHHVYNCFAKDCRTVVFIGKGQFMRKPNKKAIYINLNDIIKSWQGFSVCVVNKNNLERIYRKTTTDSVNPNVRLENSDQMKAKLLNRLSADSDKHLLSSSICKNSPCPLLRCGLLEWQKNCCYEKDIAIAAAQTSQKIFWKNSILDI